MRKLISALVASAFLALACGAVLAEPAAYVASKDSNKYHNADCGLVKNIKPENKINFQYPEEARAMGLTPCGVCKPAEHTKVVASKDSDKYHLPTCGMVKNIKKENLVEYNSPEEAAKAGKTPCGVCKPPKAVEKKS